MPAPVDESQLEHTKMSFGEHLNELRRALFKSVLALVAGFLIGLCFGWNIVDYIQGPLREALQQFYLRQAVAKQLANLEEQKAAGLPVPEDLPAAAQQMAVEALVPHDYYVSPEELAAALKPHFPELADQFPVAPPDAPRDESDDASADGLAMRRDDMIKLRLYQPLEDDLRIRVVELNAQAPFLIYMKASLFAGIVLASPFIFFFIWEFVAAGLYHTERKYVYMYLPLCLGLFLAGASLAYWKAFDYVLPFLFSFFEKMNIDPDMRLSEWISLVLMLPLGFGLSFQLPLGMLALERVGIFTVQSYLSKWRMAVVVISVISMVLTPADPYSMMIMFVPLTGLYFLGILMCKYMPGDGRETPWVPPAAPPEHGAGS